MSLLKTLEHKINYHNINSSYFLYFLSLLIFNFCVCICMIGIEFTIYIICLMIIVNLSTDRINSIWFEQTQLILIIELLFCIFSFDCKWMLSSQTHTRRRNVWWRCLPDDFQDSTEIYCRKFLARKTVSDKIGEFVDLICVFCFFFCYSHSYIMIGNLEGSTLESLKECLRKNLAQNNSL